MITTRVASNPYRLARMTPSTSAGPISDMAASPPSLLDPRPGSPRSERGGLVELGAVPLHVEDLLVGTVVRGHGEVRGEAGVVVAHAVERADQARPGQPRPQLARRLGEDLRLQPGPLRVGVGVEA